MIGVLSEAGQSQCVAEFFELFKTPWETFKANQSYDVVISTADSVSLPNASLLIISRATGCTLDAELGIATETQSSGGRINCGTDSLPLFSRLLTFRKSSAVALAAAGGNQQDLIAKRLENFDRTQPAKRFVLMLDAYTGRRLFAAGWARMPLLAQATAVGIPFHRGEFGLWNQALLALAALAAMFSVVSGLVMWWQRRPRGKLAANPPHRRVITPIVSRRRNGTAR